MYKFSKLADCKMEQSKVFTSTRLLKALEAQLRSVYIEHQNELALKDQETERAISSLREEFQRASDIESFSGKSLFG